MGSNAALQNQLKCLHRCIAIEAFDSAAYATIVFSGSTDYISSADPDTSMSENNREKALAKRRSPRLARP